MARNEERKVEGDIDSIRYYVGLLADIWNAKVKNGTNKDDNIKVLAGEVESQVKIVNYEVPIMGNPDTGQPIVKMSVKLDERPESKSTITIKNGAADLMSWEAKTKSLCFVCLHKRKIFDELGCFKASHPSSHKKVCKAFTLKYPRT
jgi:hypothetical protein